MPGGMPILPIEAYTSRAWFERERELIFSRTWALAGFAEDLAEPGLYLSVQAGLNNIFAMMGGDSLPRQWPRRRGEIVVDLPGRAARARSQSGGHPHQGRRRFAMGAGGPAAALGRALAAHAGQVRGRRQARSAGFRGFHEGGHIRLRAAAEIAPVAPARARAFGAGRRGAGAASSGDRVRMARRSGCGTARSPRLLIRRTAAGAGTPRATERRVQRRIRNAA